MRLFLGNYLICLGWHPDVITGSSCQFDIEARAGRKKWIIGVKGFFPPEGDPAKPFVSALGEMLQRMDDPAVKYSIAVPDVPPFYRLWKRLPLLAKQRTGITALFVRPTGQVREETT